MGKKRALVELHRAEPRTLERLEFAESASVAVAGLIAVASLAQRAFPAIGMGWAMLPLGETVSVLALSAGLGISLERKWLRGRAISAGLAVLAAASAIGGIVAMQGPRLTSAAAVLATHLLLASVLLVMRTERRCMGYVADAAVFAAAWLGMVLVMGTVFGRMNLFGETSLSIRPGSVAALAALTFAAFAQRAEHGWFSIFVGHGVGSRMARMLVPVVLFLPLVREIGRARLSQLHLIPDHYAAALLASLATMIALGVVVFFTRQFRRLEGDIQDLSLRDELTGLYNLRGYQILAAQTMRTAQRSGMPFSVLFVDVDNLKKINDAFGHGMGSRLLMDAAEFLKTNFRENDVIGRIGGDEFAVAGHFSGEVIGLVEARLAERLRDDETGNGCPQLSLSMGHVTALPTESLEDLLHRADEAMYQQKRSKKLLAGDPQTTNPDPAAHPAKAVASRS